MSSELKKLINNIVNGVDERASLSGLRVLVKDSYNAGQVAYELREKIIYDAMVAMLSSDDAKTRKNVALLFGDIAVDLEDEQSEEILEKMYNAYIKEDKKFVRASYLTGILSFDYRDYLERFKARYEEMENATYEESDKKHYMEELDALKKLIITIQGIKKHEFSGYNILSELVLTANRKNVETIKNELIEWTGLGEESVKTFSAGLLVKSDWLVDIIEFRPYQELFFKIPDAAVLPEDPISAAKKLVSADLTGYLSKRHKGDTPFYFRVECKSKMEMDKKSVWIKKFSQELEETSKRTLLNSKSDYELEIRLIQAADGRFNCLVKLYTIKDERFAYRKEHVAASIRPDNAALLVTLAKEYMVEDAQVLDPFCGVGTMLIERQKQVKANTSYGIDKFGEAIDKARINTEAAGQIIHYVNKDYFDFRHEYKFDEIFTDMPFDNSHNSKQSATDNEIESIYRDFFVKSKEVLSVNGRIIMYTHNKEWAVKYALKSGYKLLKHIIILEKAGTDLLIFEHTK